MPDVLDVPMVAVNFLDHRNVMLGQEKAKSFELRLSDRSNTVDECARVPSDWLHFGEGKSHVGITPSAVTKGDGEKLRAQGTLSQSLSNQCWLASKVLRSKRWSCLSSSLYSSTTMCFHSIATVDSLVRGNQE
jgi:hypothetical protein